MKRALILIAASLAGCKMAPVKVDTTTVASDYKSVYRTTKAYVEKCTSGVKVRANLFTEFPEAEIIIDYVPGGSVFVTGGIVTSTTTTAQEILNIRFKGVGKTTEVSTHDKLSKMMADKAMAKSACPSKNEIEAAH